MTHKIERLIGVDQGYDERKVLPSRSLLRTIKKLSPGTKIGLQTQPQEMWERYSSGELQADPTVVKYWDRLVQYCQRLGHQVQFLEDSEIYARYVEQIIPAFEAAQHLHDQSYIISRGRADGVSILEAMRSINEEVYRLSVLRDYTFVVERENGILSQMAQQKPQLAVISKDHSDSLMSNPQNFSAEDLEVGQYQREGIRPSEARRHLLHAAMYKEAKIDPGVVLENALMRRKYAAVTEGKIIPNGKPAAIGSWDSLNRKRGLFEIYPENGDGFNGKIEDTLGTATFQGVIDAGHVYFNKSYIMGESGTSDPFYYMSYAPVEYRGTSDDGVNYSGTYSLINGQTGEFYFALQK
jgi:hypothetical protein